MPLNPWKRADNEPTQEASTSYGFPPLSSAPPLSKSQRRTRALYTQSATFEPYPPRIEQLNRQELSRRLLLEEVTGEPGQVVNAEMGGDQPTKPQQNGISSITIYNADGESLSRGPDIYRRPTLSKAAYEKSNRIVRTPRTLPMDQADADLPLPSPFTDEKLDSLMRECGRLERIQAVEDRASTGDYSCRESAYDPLKQELLKAFSSLEGFMAAFGNGRSERGN